MIQCIVVAEFGAADGAESAAFMLSTSGRDEPAYFAALQEKIESQLGMSVFIQNDITAAAAGESIFDVAKPLTDYLFFYLGAHLHSRLILNHQIHRGNSPSVLKWEFWSWSEIYSEQTLKLSVSGAGRRTGLPTASI